MRHNTPHPKELKARHTKLFKGQSNGPEGQIDGHVIPHNTEKNKEVRPSALVTAVLVAISYLHSMA